MYINYSVGPLLLMNDNKFDFVKTVLVTGGTAGIGYAIAEAYLKHGNNVFICSRSQKKLEAALGRLKKLYGGKVQGAICDVSSYTQVEKTVSKVIDEYGSIDVLINNAGVAFVLPFDEITIEGWNSIISTNLGGIFNCCKAVLPFLKNSSCPDIVNMGSRSGRYAFAGGVGYNTTKFGVQGFTEALFLDLSRYGVRVSLVAPGTVGTGLGGTTPEEWHLTAEHVASAVINATSMERGATLNWIELRPSKNIR